MLELREFVPSDAERIVEWTGDETAFRKWCADRYDRYPIAPGDMLSFYETASKSGWFFPYTAVLDGVPVGHLIIRFPYESRRTARFGFVIVDPSRRGQGLGRELIEAAKSEAKERFGASEATIGVFANNLPAHRCYLAAGFKDISSAEEYYEIFGEKWLCIEMKAEL